jgi:pentatricopeptide repeat protein
MKAICDSAKLGAGGGALDLGSRATPCCLCNFTLWQKLIVCSRLSFSQPRLSLCAPFRARFPSPDWSRVLAAPLGPFRVTKNAQKAVASEARRSSAATTHARFSLSRRLPPVVSLSLSPSLFSPSFAPLQTTTTFQPIDLAPLEDEFASASLHQQHPAAAEAASPPSASPSSSSLPAFLTNLLDPSASVDLPPGPAAAALRLDNRELDKLVAALGRSRATWRRALMLHEWLLAAGHALDGRLATTLLRAASQHGAAVTALGLYDWMRAPLAEGGAALQPTVFTYTAAMRAALAGGLLDRALRVWDDAAAAGCAPDCRMATALVEVSARRGDTDRALAAYAAMRDAPRGSRLSPSVHAYTAAMRAAAEGGRPAAALAVWDDLEASRPAVRPTGHAFAAAISACAGAGDWRRAVRLFEAMLAQGIKPDVVSCTALVAALGGGGRADDAAAAVRWMLAAGVRPNVRTYTALLSAQAGARRWDLALDTLARMKGSNISASSPSGGGGLLAAAAAATATSSSSSSSSDAAAAAAAAGATGVEPNAYTYSALIKAAGEQGQWRLAEAIFGELEAEALAAREAQRAQQRAVAAEVGGGEVLSATAAKDKRAAAAAASPAARFRSSIDVSRRDSIDVRSFTLAAQLAEEVLDGFASEGEEEEGGSTPLRSPVAPLSPSSNSSSSSSSTTLSPSSSAAALSRYSWAAAAPASAAAAAADASNPWGGVRDDSSPLASAAAAWSPATAAAPAAASANRPPALLNEVVCGALMAAHERAGRADDAVRVLSRAAALGVQPNAVMFNTALAALGRRGRFDEALALFEALPYSPPDAVAHETLVAAAGVAGRPADAEAAFERLLAAGHAPRDYAFCGLIAAHSAAGDLKSALAVRERYAAAAAEAAAKARRQQQQAGSGGGLLGGVRSALGIAKRGPSPSQPPSPAFAAVAGAAAGAAASAAALATPAKPSVHVFNALLAACERARAWDEAVAVAEGMRHDGVSPDADTARLLQAVGRGGVGAVEDAQLAAAALSAALAAAGSLLMRTGVF